MAELKQPYREDYGGRTWWKPPCPESGRTHPRVEPSRGGHFDHLEPGTRAFGAAAAFAIVHRVITIWEHYFERPLPWFFRDTYRQLELIPHIRTEMAWSGEGFIELGFSNFPDMADAWCENFDAVAHETGHLILKGVIGNPVEDKKTLVYRAHEEASADLIALVAALHFDSFVDYLLDQTKGWLFSRNVLSRIGEHPRRKGEPGGATETWLAFNEQTLLTVQSAWAGYDPHTYSLPFSGAVYDVFVELYERKLVAAGVIPEELARRSHHSPERQVPELEREYRPHFERHRAAFKQALLDARDDFARMMARAWTAARVSGFSYEQAAANVAEADAELFRGKYAEIIGAAFVARGIKSDRAN